MGAGGAAQWRPETWCCRREGTTVERCPSGRERAWDPGHTEELVLLVTMDSAFRATASKAGYSGVCVC